MAMRLAARSLGGKPLRPVASVGRQNAKLGVRCMASDQFNPFLHPLEYVDKNKVINTIDLGDGKTQKVYDRIKFDIPAEHRPPVKLTGDIGKVTCSTYTYASMKGVLEAVEKDFVLIEKEFLSSDTWRSSSTLPIPEKLKVIKAFTQKHKVSEFTQHLLEYFTNAKLIKMLPDVIKQYYVLLKEKRGDVDCFVTSADPLDKATLKELETLLLKRVGAPKGSKVNINTSVDPNLLAGMLIYYKGTMIDTSYARRIVSFKDAWGKAYMEANT